MPATLGTYLPNDDDWIIGVVDGPFLKMVRLRVTGPTSFDWISTKYDINYNVTCLTAFSESCYVGGNAGKVSYLVRLVAEPEGAILSSFIIICLT